MTTDKMKAVICTAYGPPDVLKIKAVNKPVPKANELLVKVIATSVNSGDVKVRALEANFVLKLLMRCLFGFTRPRKPVLGTVYAGRVEQTGEHVKEFAVGDEVYGLTGFNFGTYADYLLAAEHSVIAKKPKNASFDEAAAIAFGGQTAIYFLQKTRIAETPGLHILVYGASSAVGTSVLQVAKYYHAYITAVCSENGKDLVLELGADTIIDYRTSDFTKSRIKYDIIFDAVGKLSKSKCAHLLSKEGVFITVGGFEYAKERREQLDFLNTLFESGNYNAAIDRTYSMEEIVEAHRYVDTGRKKGNVVVRIFPGYN